MIPLQAIKCTLLKCMSILFYCVCRYELTHSKYVDKLPAGKHSTKGLGRTAPTTDGHKTTEEGVVIPMGKGSSTAVDNTSLLYNEYPIHCLCVGGCVCVCVWVWVCVCVCVGVCYVLLYSESTCVCIVYKLQIVFTVQWTFLVLCIVLVYCRGGRTRVPRLD